MSHTTHRHGALEVSAEFEHTALLLAGPTRPDQHATTRVSLRVRNGGDHPLAFTFATTQRFEIELVGDDGAALSRWSDGRMFGQIVTTEELAPRHSWSFEGELRVPPGGGLGSRQLSIRIYVTADRRPGAIGTLQVTVAP